MGGYSLDRLTGETVDVNGYRLNIQRQLGEGGFAFVYLAKVKHPRGRRSKSRGRSLSLGRRMFRSLSRGGSGRRRLRDYEDDQEEEEYDHHNMEDVEGGSSSNIEWDANPLTGEYDSYSHNQYNRSPSSSSSDLMVLKTASAATTERRIQAENELRFLRMLNGNVHVVNLIDYSFQSSIHPNGNSINSNSNGSSSQVCYMLLEHCEGGSLLEHIMQEQNDTSLTTREFEVLEYFSQICEAVHYLHTFHDDEDETIGTTSESITVTSLSAKTNIHARASPYKASAIFRRVGQHYGNPIVHRDLKLENVLLKRDASMPTGFRCQLCDFGSAIEGRIDLRSAEDRRKQGEIIRSSTTQMYRAPEMVDLHLVPQLTERTDVWSLGCCLYTLCFRKNCFGENSNLSILSGQYSIPIGHMFQQEIVELIARMLCLDPNQRASIDEVLECLDAIKNSEVLPPRVSNGKRQTPVKKERKIYTLDSFTKHNCQDKARQHVVEHTSGEGSHKGNWEKSLRERTPRLISNEKVNNNRPESGGKLNPKSAAAKRLQSVPQQTKLISPNEITTIFPLFSEVQGERHLSSSPTICGKHTTINIQGRRSEKEATIAKQSPYNTEKLQLNKLNNNKGWANFSENDEQTYETALNNGHRGVSSYSEHWKGISNDESCIKAWGFDAFYEDNVEVRSNRVDQSCGFPAFPSSSIGQCSTSQSHSQDEGHCFERADGGVETYASSNEFSNHESSRLMRRLKLDGVAKSFFSSAKSALTSCQNEAHTATL